MNIGPPVSFITTTNRKTRFPMINKNQLGLLWNVVAHISKEIQHLPNLFIHKVIKNSSRMAIAKSWILLQILISCQIFQPIMMPWNINNFHNLTYVSYILLLSLPVLAALIFISFQWQVDTSKFIWNNENIYLSDLSMNNKMNAT